MGTAEVLEATKGTSPLVRAVITIATLLAGGATVGTTQWITLNGRVAEVETSQRLNSQITEKRLDRIEGGIEHIRRMLEGRR